MLWTPGNHFNFTVDNWGSTFQSGSIGTAVVAGGSAHTKGSNTNLLNGIAEDCYGISICFAGLVQANAVRRGMVDILIDPAAGAGNAGSSWSVAIANLYFNSPAYTAGAGYWYYFPLFFKAGTAIGAAHQNTTASVTVRVAIMLFGKPTRPELVQVGTRVQTIGATTASTTGVSFTPGSGSMGSYSASMGTTNFDAWWWQVGMGVTDTTAQGLLYFIDLAANATNKILLIEHLTWVSDTGEASGKSAFGLKPPMKNIASGDNIYVRGAAIDAPDTGCTAVAYALGG